jgi:hypothetical protein
MSEDTSLVQLSESFLPDVLADIYLAEKNIVVWRRILPPDLVLALQRHLQECHSIRLSLSLSPEDAEEALKASLSKVSCGADLAKILAELVEMFCCLFDLERAGLRLTTLDQAMCPKFHVDKVPCRLVTTLTGPGTEWLPNDVLNRDGLGAGAEHFKLYDDDRDIQQMTLGDVALIKGERWVGNENRGVVHRSPSVKPGEKRLLMTLDFAD